MNLESYSELARAMREGGAQLNGASEPCACLSVADNAYTRNHFRFWVDNDAKFVRTRGFKPVIPAKLYAPRKAKADIHLVRQDEELMKGSQEVWAFGSRLTNEVRNDLEMARCLGKPIRYFKMYYPSILPYEYGKNWDELADDGFNRFIKAYCDVGENRMEDYWTLSKAYENYCDNNYEKRKGLYDFNIALENRGFKKAVDRKKIQGLSLKEQPLPVDWDDWMKEGHGMPKRTVAGWPKWRWPKRRIV